MFPQSCCWFRAGCTPQQNPQELKEKTAQETAMVKRDAKAVAEGIREGWSRDKPLDLNTATKDQLLSLPGLTAAEADRVIAGRPFHEPSEVVTSEWRKPRNSGRGKPRL